ncbi:MAG TPA: tetratricopeptide repeat protein [Trichormus sp.]|jgi:tetratricopeptide (TPR) repeat protein
MKRLALCSISVSLLCALPAVAQTHETQAHSSVRTKTMQYCLDGKPVTEKQVQAINLYNQSIPLINSGDWAQAMSLLQRAVELDPHRIEALTGLGKCQAHLNMIDQALATLHKATEVGPGYSFTWLEYGSALEGWGRLDGAIAAYTQFISRFPADAQVPEVSALLSDLKKEVSAQTAAKDSGSTSGSDYFVNATAKGFTRWAPDKMPLKVYIAPAVGLTGYRPAFGKALYAAFDRWKDASDNLFSFTFVQSPADADIDCKFTDDISKVHSLAEHGDTVSEITPKGLEHAAITILTVEDPNDQDKLTDNLMYGICLHELGHALGVRGHSLNPTDVMFFCVPTGDRRFDLSSRDIATVHHIYSTDIRIANAVLIGESDAVSLNNDGVELLSKGNIDEAISKFETSLSLSHENNPARHNLCMALNNQGIALCKETKYDQAEPILKRASELVANDDSNRMSIVKNYVLLLTLMHKNSEADKWQTTLAQTETPHK